MEASIAEVSDPCSLPAMAEASPTGNEEAALQIQFTASLAHITRHSAVYLAGSVFTMGASYFVKIYVVRKLGAELLGLYALGMTLVSFMQLFGLLGLPGTAARYVAAYNATGKTDRLKCFVLKSSVFVVVLNFCLAVLMLLSGNWIAQHFYHSAELARYMPAFALLMWFGAISVFYGQVLGGFKDVAKRTIITNFIGTPAVLLLTIALLAGGTRLWGYLAAQVLGTGIIIGLLLRAVWKLMPPAARPSAGRWGSLDRDVFSFAAASFAMSGIDFLSTQADKILIGLYLAARPLGIYVLASTLAAFVPLILQAVNQIFAPVIADLHAKGRHDVLQRLFQTLTKWVLALTLPLAMVVITFAPQLMRLFGPEFEPGWPVLAIVALGQIVNCGVGSVGYLLLMSGNQKRLMKVQLVMAIVSVAVNLALIPSLGIIGAALAAALVNTGGNLWNLVEVRRSLHISPYTRGYYRLLFPTGLTLGSLAVFRLFVVPGHWVILLVAIVLGYAIFALSMFAFGMDADDQILAADGWRQLRGALLALGVIS
jgi:O-antigen/teichoic acid export membrane protein